MAAGLALDLIQFPKDAASHVGLVLSEQTQFHLVLVWGPVAAVIAVISLVIFKGYGISEGSHG